MPDALRSPRESAWPYYRGVCLALTLPTQGCGRSSSPDAAPAARYRASGSAYVPSQVQGGSVLELPHGGLLGLGEGGNVYWLDRSLRQKVVFWKRPACASIFPGNIAAGASGHVYILGSATGNCVPTTPNAVSEAFKAAKTPLSWFWTVMGGFSTGHISVGLSSTMET